MYMSRCYPLMAIISVSFFLTAGFFVLLALRKVTEKGLRIFGYVTVGFLLLSVLIVFSGAASNLGKDSFGMRGKMSQKMKNCGMGQMMGQTGMPEMPMQEK
ncbi:MAG: hypothetical protein WC571_02940 [Candidatus Omnitrophota bacterium]